MCLLIRFVDTITQYADAKGWTKPDDAIQAAADFIDNRDGDVSIYRIENQASLPRVAAALSLSHRERLQARRYVTVPEREFLKATDLVLDDTQLGRTPDVLVNVWHRNIKRPTKTQSLLCAFAFGRSGNAGNFSLPSIQSYVKACISAGHSDLNLVSPEMRSWLCRRNLLGQV